MPQDDLSSPVIPATDPAATPHEPVDVEAPRPLPRRPDYWLVDVENQGSGLPDPGGLY